ncbi:MAG: methionine--tRNA ligase [Betaproteobacteria bacterium TMED41]|nr:MAG: methionine--tRNA ligase [Betaproteobacteria bacterium TMED41]
MLQRKKRKIFVTSALPYANGPIHLGHLVEYVQTDIWVRFQKLLSNFTVYICADDAHGTPIMLRAQKEKITPEELIDKVWKEHTRDFSSFFIAFDSYFTTHSEENRELSSKIYKNLADKGLVAVKKIKQMFDTEKQMFLPDRFIKGECPKCMAKDQFGDACEVCGATYNPTELVNPKSELSGKTPITKESDHHFFLLSNKKCVSFLKQWTTESGRLQSEALNKINEWLKSDSTGKSMLTDWDISRDPPYFGFEIPDEPMKFFYVWLDAPIGYYASLKNWCKKNDKNFYDFVKPDSKYEQVHFIGKDILYFHSLFWPAILKFSGYRVPTAIYAHGFLTINGKKMSKSKGTYITAEEYIKAGLNPEWLRYYIAAKLNGTMEDIDLNLEDFMNKINSDLVGKYINILSRTSGFVTKFFEGKVIDYTTINNININISDLEKKFSKHIIDIQNNYEQRNTSRVIRDLVSLMDSVNLFIDDNKPWILAKKIAENPIERESLEYVLAVSLNYFAKLTILIKPILPAVALRVENEVFNIQKPWLWEDIYNLEIKSINPVGHLISRVDQNDLQKINNEV